MCLSDRWDALPTTNTRVNRVLLRNFLVSSKLTYGQENSHDKYFMYNGYLCIEPCPLAHGCIRWVYPLGVLIVIYKMKLKNIVYEPPSRLNMWDGGLDITCPLYFPLLLLEMGKAASAEEITQCPVV